MSNPLVPEQRVDRNGRIVTRHVNASSQPTGKGVVIPPPTAVTKKQSGKRTAKAPLPKQLERGLRTPARFSNLNYDEGLFKFLNERDGTNYDWTEMLWVKANEVDTYAAFAVAGIDNGLLLLNSDTVAGKGNVTSDEIEKVLTENGMSRLVVDHREMMQQALDRRIKSSTVVKLHTERPMENYHPQVFLDAARIADSTKLDPSFHYGVLNGSISYDDVEALGITFISKGDQSMILRKLENLQSGELSYDINTLKYMLEHSHGEYQLETIERLVSTHGEDFMLNLDDPAQAARAETKLKRIGKDTEYRRDFIEKLDEGGMWPRQIVIEEALKLYEAGVDLSEGAKMSIQNEMVADRVIEVHQEGIHGSVSQGWL